MIGFLKAAWDLVWGWLAGIFRWLRRPGSWVKVLFAALAFLAAVATLQSYKKSQRIFVLVEEGKANTVKFERREAELLTSLEAYKAQEQDFARIARENTQRLESARAESAKATATAKVEKDRAEQGRVSFQSAFNNRPDSCKAALESLELACPALSDY